MSVLKHFTNLTDLIKEYNYSDPICYGTNYFVAYDNVLHKWCYVSIIIHNNEYIIDPYNEPRCYKSKADISKDPNILL